MSKSKLSILVTLIVALCLTVLPPLTQAAPKAKAQAAKENLVLMPLRLGEADMPLQGAMETALLEGLQQKYQVFTGDKVDQRRREVFAKESKKGKTDCDETKCLQDIAAAFNSELLAVVSVAKQSDGYFLAINIRNLWDDKVVYSKSVPCKGCDTYAVVDKLKELIGAQVTGATEDIPTPVKANDSESILWNEAQKGNTADDYQVYLDAYPKGKYGPFAKARIKKIKDAMQAVVDQKEQQVWQLADQSGREESYQGYLGEFPQGRYVGFAKSRINRLQTDQAAREEQALWQQVQSSTDAKAVQGYLDKYPNGSHAVVARKRLPELTEDELWNSSLGIGTSAAMQTYLGRYPNGRHVAEARLKDEEYRNLPPIPPRPPLPFTVSEEIWHAIESSKAYLYLPRPRSIKVKSRTETQTELNGNKDNALSMSILKTGTSLGSKCAEVDTDMGGDADAKLKNYSCGSFISLGSMMNGELQSQIKNIELQGSLFPLRVGAEQSVRTHYASASSKFDHTAVSKCRVVSKGLAQDVAPKLTGVAWSVNCEINNQFPNNPEYKPTTSMLEDYFLEDMGVFFSEFGAPDHLKHKYVLPAPGTSTTLIPSEGLRFTITYKSYEWSVGE